ncbi:MAG: DUF5908 family protein [bacterium]
MAVEIKELIIRATVNSGSHNEAHTGDNVRDNVYDTQKIIRACVEQVLKILKREKER